MSATSRSNALTAIAPLKRWRLWWCRLVLPALRILVTSSALARLRFIHFGGWVVIGDPPGPAPHGWRARPSMIFLSNYDGDLAEYLASFGIAVGSGMRWTFGSAEGFPGTRPTRRFIGYVDEHRVEELLRYAAYPERTVREVDEALEVARRLVDLRRAAAAPDDAFRAAYRALLGALGRAPAPRVPGFWVGLWRAIRARSTVRGLVALVPVAPGREGELRTAVAGLAGEHPSVFDCVGGVHFARLAIADLPGRWDPRVPAGRADAPDAPAYLLLAAWVDGDPQAFLDRLAASLGEWADAIWGCCAGYPGRRDAPALVAWLARHRVPISLFVGCRSGVPAPEICVALARREQAFELVEALQDRPLAEVRAGLSKLAGGGAGKDLEP